MFHLFPHGLDATLLIPVLLGVLVNAAFTEFFGWDFVGLVVPGYLCSVIMLQPIVAAVVLVEAVVTWSLARAVDGVATRAGAIYPVFGRDRFFLILVVSVLVRSIIEGLAMPPALAMLRGPWPSIARHEPDLFGIGLVLVPLLANRLWNPGLRSGLFQLTVETAGVRLLLLGLQVFTNFSVAGFELSFDRLALGFLTAPGAQIVLICTAALASHFNRRFGWDSHGILVPALLGLVVMAPLKMLATVVETVLIVAALSALVRLPRLRQMNLEGPRKIVLCFVLGFTIRSIFVAALGAAYPGYRASDLFGFGYLLPSLLAERIIARGRATMVVLTTIQTALLGIPLAGGVALALDRVAPSLADPSAPARIEQYPTLAAAIAAHAHTWPAAVVVPGGRTESLAHAVSRAQRGAVDARTDDGYRVSRIAGTRTMVAILGADARPASTVLLVAPDEWRSERAAAEAGRLRMPLLIAAPDDARAAEARRLGVQAAVFVEPDPAPSVVAVDFVAEPVRALLRPAPLSDAASAPMAAAAPESRALQEVAFRLQRDRDDRGRLSAALQVFGLTVRATSDGRTLVTGSGWPSAVLRGGSGRDLAQKAVLLPPLTVAPHAREMDTGAAALLACDVLVGDCVLANDSATSGPDAPAMVLATAMAQARPQPLLIVRGTDDRLAGDVLVFNTLASDAPWPDWAAGLQRATRDWLLPSHLLPLDAAPFRRFPIGVAQLPDATLLWLSVRARRALAGDSSLGRPDFIALAASRGLAVVKTDLPTWLAAGDGSPVAGAVAEAERLAETGDPIFLQRRLSGVDAALLLDETRGLCAVGLDGRGRRALVVAGDRRDERVTISSLEKANAALTSGARTLLAAGRQ